MLYRIVGKDGPRIVIQFMKRNVELTFQTYREAEDYLEEIRKEKVIPGKYNLEIVA